MAAKNKNKTNPITFTRMDAAKCWFFTVIDADEKKNTFSSKRALTSAYLCRILRLKVRVIDI
jgi:hypothetical protein